MNKHLNIKHAVAYSFLTAITYHLASLGGLWIAVLPLFFVGLIKQSEVANGRMAFYCGLLSGMLIYCIHLRFFYQIFSTAAIALWLIFSFWMALFVMGSHFYRKRLATKFSALTIPVLYFSLEVFRSELYPLKFSWGVAGFHTFKAAYPLGLSWTGIYGFSLIIILIVSVAMAFKRKTSSMIIAILCVSMAILASTSPSQELKENNSPLITGIQLEFPDKKELLVALNKAIAAHPESDIFMLSEYAISQLSTGVPQEILNWCRDNKKYIVGGAKFKHETIEDEFYNTAIAINPQGEIELKQVKCTPIQFFKDGLPATEQKLWSSPWGEIGLCICYDLSYTQVTDELVRQGAKALLIPTMDVEDWGKNQHLLHSRVAPVKSVEYQIPIFKVCSSGISQFLDGSGNLLDSAPYPGQGEMLTAYLPMTKDAALPFDRYLIYPSFLFSFMAIILCFKRKLKE